MKHSAPLHIMITCFSLLAVAVCGQRYYRHNNYSDHYLTDGNRYNTESSRLDRNHCPDFFMDTTGRSHITFKTLTVSNYHSSDTIVAHKRFVDKTRYEFNKLGENVLTIGTDSTGRVTDSVAFKYSDKPHYYRMTTYKFSEKKKKLDKFNDEVTLLDSKNNMLKDSTWRNEDGYIRAQVIGYVYDNAGNPILYYSLSNGRDTTSTIYYTYNSKNEETSESESSNGRWQSNYMTYDTAGHVTLRKYISGTDTTVTYFTYNNKNRQISKKVYKNSHLAELQYTEYLQDSGRKETTQQIGDNTTNTCPNDSKTVTIRDKKGNILSEIETGEGEGKAYTRKNLHTYKYSGKKLVKETENNSEVSKGYESKSGSTTTYAYDTRGNMTEMNVKGGSYSDNTRQTWTYNAQNNILVYNEYEGACLDKPTEATIDSYYPDGKTRKEEIENNGYTKTITRYGVDTRKLEVISIQKDYGATIAVSEYEKW
jgi:YD repeat-containing protein